MIFRLTRQLPNGWFNDVHRAITEATTHTELDKLRNAIEEEANDFFTSRRDRAAFSLLYAWANIRYRHLTAKMYRNSKLRVSEFNKIHK